MRSASPSLNAALGSAAEAARQRAQVLFDQPKAKQQGNNVHSADSQRQSPGEEGTLSPMPEDAQFGGASPATLGKFVRFAGIAAYWKASSSRHSASIEMPSVPNETEPISIEAFMDAPMWSKGSHILENDDMSPDGLDGVEMLWVLGALPAGSPHSQKLQLPFLDNIGPKRRRASHNEPSEDIQLPYTSFGFWPTHGGYQAPARNQRGAPVPAAECIAPQPSRMHVGAQYTQPLQRSPPRQHRRLINQSPSPNRESAASSTLSDSQRDKQILLTQHQQNEKHDYDGDMKERIRSSIAHIHYSTQNKLPHQAHAASSHHAALSHDQRHQDHHRLETREPTQDHSNRRSLHHLGSNLDQHHRQSVSFVKSVSSVHHRKHSISHEHHDSHHSHHEDSHRQERNHRQSTASVHHRNHSISFGHHDFHHSHHQDSHRQEWNHHHRQSSASAQHRPHSMSFDHTDSHHSHQQDSHRQESPLRVHQSFFNAYTLGAELGSGCFGIVYSCRRHGHEIDAAVKFIDKADASTEAILREIDVLECLDHPSIVRLQEVCLSKCFVCIVMDKFAAGTLVNGIERYTDANGAIPCPKIAPVLKQALEPIFYLHCRRIVHLGIRADNYLMDQGDIVSPDLRIILIDFGTAQVLSPGERLSFQTGVVSYWAPEIWKCDYGFKADIWAVGVLGYIMHSYQVPFAEDEDEVCFTSLDTGSCIAAFAEFLDLMMAKLEEDRPTAAEALLLPWLTEEHTLSEDDVAIERLRKDALLKKRSGTLCPKLTSKISAKFCALSARLSIDTDWKTKFQGRRQGGFLAAYGATQAVLERRREIIRRMEANQASRVLQRSQASSLATEAVEFKKHRFEQHSKETGLTAVFEWWAKSKVTPETVLQETGAHEVDEASCKETTMHAVRQLLVNQGVDLELFGTGDFKTLDELAEEVSGGSARLMIDAAVHQGLVRVVDMVQLRIAHRGDKHLQYLLETKEQASDGHMITEQIRFPCCPLLPHESKRVRADKMLFERLNMTDCNVAFEEDLDEVFEEEDETCVYPGIRTIYRKHYMDGIVTTVDELVLHRIGFSTHSGAAQEGCEWKFQDFSDVTRYFTWISEKHARAKHLLVSAPWDADSEQHSALVDPPIGMNEHDLWSHLMQHNIDPTQYSSKGTKTLKEFSDELSRGESVLLERDGKLCRFVDKIHVHLCNKTTNEVLMQVEEFQSEEQARVTQMLPCGTKRPDENRYIAAKRLLQSSLRMNSDGVHIIPGSARIYESAGMSQNLLSESIRYPGLQTIQRTHLVYAEQESAATIFLSTKFTSAPHKQSIPNPRKMMILAKAARGFSNELDSSPPHKQPTSTPSPRKMMLLAKAARGFSNE